MSTTDQKLKLAQKILPNSTVSVDSEFNYQDAMELARHGFQMKAAEHDVIVSFTGGMPQPNSDLKINKRVQGTMAFKTEQGETIINFNFSALLTRDAKFKIFDYVAVN